MDQHHTVEDLGIALGEAVSEALGNRRGINRAGYFVMPMDETLAVAAIDPRRTPAHGRRSERAAPSRVGDLQTELVHDFFEGFAIGARANVHVKVIYGRSSHHKVEAVLQGICAGAACGLRERQAAREDAAVDQRTSSGADLRASSVALIDYQRRQSHVGAKGTRRGWRAGVRAGDAGGSRRSVGRHRAGCRALRCHTRARA